MAPRTLVLRCAYCHDSAGLDARCEGCNTLLHGDCARALDACPTLGCTARLVAPRRPLGELAGEAAGTTAALFADLLVGGVITASCAAISLLMVVRVLETF